MTTAQERRLNIGQLVAGQLLPSGQPVRIRDIAFGGFAMETSFPVDQDAVLGFRFKSRDGSSFEVSARVVHTRKVVGPDTHSYFSGLEFADQFSSMASEMSDILVERVNWILSFYAAADDQ
jgi:hypothetical protein